MHAIFRFTFINVLIALCLAHANAQTTDTKAIEIPMQLEGGMPVIEVQINGQGPFLFGIDTGAQGTARIDSALVERLGLKPTGEIRAGDPSMKNVQASATVKLDSIVAGGRRFADVTAVSRNYRNSPRPMKVDGILGLTLFGDSLVTLDFPAKMVRIRPGELSKADGSEILDYKSENGVPLVELSVGGQKIGAHLDSGNAMGAFVFPAAFVEKLALSSELVVVGKARSASGDMEIKQARLKEAVRLGRHEFPEATITFPALGEIANVGAKVLNDFVVTFDQRNQRVRLTRAENGTAK
jgi:predicted aspartyl protease